MAVVRNETVVTAPVEYATTEDGYRIACAVSGAGEPFLMAPCLLQNDILRHIDGTAAFVGALEQRFQVFRYDGRGTGRSTRGVSEDVSLDDTLKDLEAVVDHFGLKRFVLYGDVFFSYTALLAESRLKDAVRAVVLVNPAPLNGQPFMAAWETMYTSSWELFTNTFVSTFGGDGMTGERMRECVRHDDFVRLARSARGHRLGSALGRVSSPTLVLANRSPLDPALAATASEIASAIPQSRLMLFDGHRNADILTSPGGGVPPAIPAIEQFLATLAAPATEHSADRDAVQCTLSARELEVLRLLAAGRSNAQIAEALVISHSTVAKHVTSILAKTESRNRAEATSFAYRHGLL